MKYFFVALFVVFALVQYNDPDGWIWAIAYANIAIILGCPPFIYKKWFVMLSLIIYVVVTLGYIPDFIQWIQIGSPSIAGTMKAENPEIELVREFLGLVICNAALIHQWYEIKNNR